MLLTCSKTSKALDPRQLETAQIELRAVRFAEGDVVALKHNRKRYLEPFILAILRENLHRSNDGIFECTMRFNWLEPSEEDPLVYTVGNEDNSNPPQCILDIALNSGPGWWEIYPKQGRIQDFETKTNAWKT